MKSSYDGTKWWVVVRSQKTMAPYKTCRKKIQSNLHYQVHLVLTVYPSFKTFCSSECYRT